ncbi:hypothetical protein [Agromyces terreus]|uniref:hypothetical protein n=1 Tax=Agromyces terreus TaxID=424795 RepID=UPI0031DDE34F
MRVRPGWVAASDAPSQVIRAVRVGGALTAGSAAELHGLWLLGDDRLHDLAPQTASRLRSPHDAAVPLDRRAHRVCVHYRAGAGAGGAGAGAGVGGGRAGAGGDTGAGAGGGVDAVARAGGHERGGGGRRERAARPARDGLITAIAEMFRCSGAVPAMVALESALNRGRLDMPAVEQLRALSSAWVGRRLDEVSCDSDSGLETIARMLMHRLRVVVRAQVRVPGVRRVDLLVGERLVIELDGRSFHSGDDFDRDRRQDLELTLRGYLVVRISYRMVVEEWDATQRSLRELVTRGLHRAGHPGRLLPPFGAPNAARGVSDAGNEDASPL